MTIQSHCSAEPYNFCADPVIERAHATSVRSNDECDVRSYEGMVKFVRVPWWYRVVAKIEESPWLETGSTAKVLYDRV